MVQKSVITDIESVSTGKTSGKYMCTGRECVITGTKSIFTGIELASSDITSVTTGTVSKYICI